MSWSCRFVRAQVPVILVGNKIDLRGEDLTNPKLQEDMEPIMEEFKVRFMTGAVTRARAWSHASPGLACDRKWRRV
jgi:GTPase SAR1 family protein